MHRNLRRPAIALSICLSVISLLTIGLFTLSAQTSRGSYDEAILANVARQFSSGREIFRFDTFGSEAFWGGQLQLHQAIAGAANGGIGPGLSPRQALGLGLKVDVSRLPDDLVKKLRSGKVNLDDPAVTVALLRLNAVVGVGGFFHGNGSLRAVGIRCSLCHSTVDNSLLPGVGRRLDGWANRDLNVGAIIAFSPDIAPLTNLLKIAVPSIDDAMVRSVLNSWGPGKFDAQLILDGKAVNPVRNTPAATLLPPAFGLAGFNNHTWTGSWGTVSYWNAFVANLEMQGQGVFFDPRLDNAAQYPIAAAAGFGHKRSSPDLVTSKLAPLHFYQLSLPSPVPPRGSFNRPAAERGRAVFNGKAMCASCHVPPLFTEPGWNLHLPSEIGIESFQADRSPDHRYRTAPLRGLWTHQKGGFYHDGRFATLMDVVNHYNAFMSLALTDAEKSNLVEYLKSL